MLKDSFGRQIDYLRISLTDRCNLRCIYCLPAEGIKLLPSSEILRYEEILRFLGIMAKLGISKIRLTGGEPLLRSNIIEFVKSAKNIPGIKDMGMTTNGIYLYEKIEELYKAGLKRINISLNTLKEERYGRITGQNGRSFKDIIRGIDKAISLGMNPIKINVVVLKGINDDELGDFAGFSKKKNLEVRFIEYMPVKKREIGWEDTFVSVNNIKSVIEKEHGKLIPFDSSCSSGPAEYFKLQGTKGVLGFISPISSSFCQSCNRLRLTSDGKLRLCLFSDEEVDVKIMLRSGAGEEDIVNLVKKAVLSKPKQHNLNLKEFSFSECQRTMAEIGG